MLNVVDKEYFDKVMDFAIKAGKEKSLQEGLNFLGTYACHEDKEKTRCDLYKDFAPASFYFVMFIKGKDGEYKRYFNGGLIFHGQHDGFGDGSFPTLSVCLNPTDGWSVHT